MPLLPEQADVLALLADLDDVLGPRAALFWGNLLGAVRHGGFVPWDDDLDLLLPRTDLPAVRAACAARGLATVDHPAGFVKVFRPGGAVCRPDLPWRWPFLDLFPYDLGGGDVVTRLGSRVVRLPAARVLPFRPVLFEGAARLAPACPLAVLEALFGDYPVYRIKAYDHRAERAVPVDEIVERVNAAHWRAAAPAARRGPSPFAPVAVAAFAAGRGRVIDLGSGGGGDAAYLRGAGLEVDECDPFAGPGGDALTVDLAGYGRAYSRWLLHTLSGRQQRALLGRLGGLGPGAVVALEFRDPADAPALTPVANDPRLYFDGGHFRRLISADEVVAGAGRGFEVVAHALGRFSRTAESDPVLNRLILRRV